MLDIQTIDLLARLLGTNSRRLSEIAERSERYCEDLVLIDPAKPGKLRPIVKATRPLRRLQERVYHGLLAPNHRPSRYSHGGVRGRNIKTNVSPHLGSTFLHTTDIADFYPSVRHTRVYELFVDRFGCSPDVARICTKLCTYRHHLPQGFVTSPILADCLMTVADRRIGAMCAKAGIVYTRFVDDISLSGPYPVDSGSYPKLLVRILETCGFDVNRTKEVTGRLSDGKAITKLRVKRGRIDIHPDYLAAIHVQLGDAARLAQGGNWVGTYHTADQILGRIRYVGWVNPGRLRGLLRRYRSIPWTMVETEALARGLVAPRKQVAPARVVT